MDSPGPYQRQHFLDQYMAHVLDVQARLASHKEALVDSGLSVPEAWALCQRVEERLLGPAMDMAEARLEMERRMEEFLADEVKRLRPEP